MKISPKLVILLNSIFLVVLVAFSVNIMSVEQCPFEYTQEQIDASDCIVGANLGGVFILFGFIPLGFTSSWFTYQYYRNYQKSVESKKTT